MVLQGYCGWQNLPAWQGSCGRGCVGLAGVLCGTMDGVVCVLYKACFVLPSHSL